MVYSLLWVMQDLYHQPYFVGCGAAKFRQINETVLGDQMTLKLKVLYTMRL